MLNRDDEMQPKTLRDEAYLRVRQGLMQGMFVPGQKITLRSLAAGLGTSHTPVREALRRLISEGAIEGAANRSVRVPLMTRTKMTEIREIRVALEGLAAANAAQRISAAEIAHLRTVSLEIMAARDRGDVATDMARIEEFHVSLYRASAMPTLFKMIENLWLQTGPYMNLLFPHYVRTKSADWRARLCNALESRDSCLARQIIEEDIRSALTYFINLADTDDVIHPPSPSSARRARTHHDSS